MNSYVDYTQLQIDKKSRQDLLFLYEKYMNHEFDLLGSGWVKVEYGMQAKGFRGNRYITDKYNYLKSLFLNKFIDKESDNYVPINWFIDYKSGFYFQPVVYNTPEKCLSVIEEKRGVEIKCPWELGRFYHLVQLALLATFEANKRMEIIKEFRDEVLDFVYMNPIGKTVQWSAVMDASIRNVNLLVAYDILKQLDTKGILDCSFDAIFQNLIYKGTKFILNNLEFSGERKGNTNHYLSNLVGVAFAAAYLPETSETNSWLVFAVQEMIEQFEYQFFKDGSNFEGSTSYHRLSTEFVLYTTALIYGVLRTERKKAFSQYDVEVVECLKNKNRQKYSVTSEYFFPQWYLERLYNAGIFTKVILKSNEEIVQIGDNDSGRLIKLSPLLKHSSDKGDLEENVLDHSSLLSALSGLYDTERFASYKEKCPLEHSFILALAGKTLRMSNENSLKPCVQEEATKNFEEELKYYKRTVLYQEQMDYPLNESGDLYYYDKFGVWVYRNERVFVSMAMPPQKKVEISGHRHNDVLSIEVLVDKQYITRDPGGYIYTSAPNVRNRFRSVRAHNTICVNNKEQNTFQGTFGLKYRIKGQLISYKDNVIIARADYGDVEHVRKVYINTDSIVIEDYCNYPFKVAFKNKIYSTGYGKIIRRG